MTDLYSVFRSEDTEAPHHAAVTPHLQRLQRYRDNKILLTQQNKQNLHN